MPKSKLAQEVSAVERQAKDLQVKALCKLVATLCDQVDVLEKALEKKIEDDKRRDEQAKHNRR